MMAVGENAEDDGDKQNRKRGKKREGSGGVAERRWGLEAGQKER